MIKRQDIIKIISATYKITRFIPENEPLRFKIRDTANDILALIIGSGGKKAFDSKINIILAYFDVAKMQNWVDGGHFNNLKRNYNKLKDVQLSNVRNKEEVIKTNKVKSVTKPPKIKSIASLKASKPSRRQTQIINLVKIRGQISLNELKRSFPQVTPRTLRRDINVLSEKGIIQRIRSAGGEVVFIIQNQISSGHLFNN